MFKGLISAVIGRLGLSNWLLSIKILSMNEKYQKYLETEFTIFDIETSGLNPSKDEILEIAGLKVKGKEIIGRFEALIQPTRPIPPEVEKIHGLNEFFLLVNGRPSSEVLDEFKDFIGNTIISGHNIREFDWLFVLGHFQKRSLPLLDNKLIDTLELSRKLLSLPAYNLTAVGAHFGFENKNAHRAMADVEINTKVFFELMEKLLAKKE